MSLNEWEVYELLKGNKKYNTEQLKQTEKETIIEGIKEYTYVKRSNTENINKMINDNINHIPMIY